MKVAVSSHGREMCSTPSRRFGKATYFLIVESKSDDVSVFDNSPNVNIDFGAGGKTADQLIEMGVKAVITGRVCHATFDKLKQNDVAVYLATAASVEELVARLKSGHLLPVDSVKHNS
jgi:predicted Fe-Mo cluster-binding NifX family protein